MVLLQFFVDIWISDENMLKELRERKGRKENVLSSEKEIGDFIRQ